MRIRYVITIVFAAALIAVVLTSALYINWVNANTPPKPDLDVQFVYAYLTQPTENVAAGLTYGTSEVREGYNTTSYVMILKVTNRGTEMASMTQLGAVLAEHVTENKIGLNDTNGNPAKGSLGGPSFGISNILIADQRAAMSTVGFSNRLEAKETRLIALTGVVSLNKFDQQYLQRGNLWIWGTVTAQTGYADGPTRSGPDSQTAYEVKEITLRPVGDGYLYNALLGSNQTLVPDGLDARVVSAP